VWPPQKNLLFTGDVAYVDRVLGHGKVTNLATAQAQTRDLLRALRGHMKKAVDDGTDISAAVKSFDARPFTHMKHAEVWIPQLANHTYLEMERE
jgi:hypothetical protein